MNPIQKEVTLNKLCELLSIPEEELRNQLESILKVLPPTLNTEDVTAYFNTSKSTIDRAIRAGKLKYYKQGQLRKFKREWVLEYEARLIAESSA